jgi:pimeloyl-ACP methyl ester carboxylesterase
MLRHVNRFGRLALVLIATTSIASATLGSGQRVNAQDTGATLPLEPCTIEVGAADPKRQEDALCGVLQVPENRENPDGKLIDLQVTVIPAINQDNKGLPVFHFEGGPGAGARNYFGMAWWSAYYPIRLNHDVVLIDQRGTGESAPLQCSALVDYTRENLDVIVSEEQSLEDAIRLTQECLVENSANYDPANFTSIAHADDTNDVREALGYDQILVFGNSYGTWLGQVFLGRHGEHIAGVVLDSVVGPWDFFPLYAGIYADRALDLLLELCETDEACNTAYPDLRGDVERTIARLSENPVVAPSINLTTAEPINVAMTETNYLGAVRAALYNSSTYALMPQAIAGAADENYLILGGLVAAQADQVELVTTGLYYSVICAENIAFITPEQIAGIQGGERFGSAQATYEEFTAICNEWRSAELDAASLTPVTSDVPVLIVQGNIDPITPPAFAEATIERYPNGTMVILPYQGHAPTVNNYCAQQLVTQFFADPTTELDTSCAADDVRPLFSGAYTVELDEVEDTTGKFESADLPVGWERLDESAGISADSPLAYYASNDETQQILAVGVFQDTSSDDAVAQTEAAVAADLQAHLDVVADISLIGIRTVQYGVHTPDNYYTAAIASLTLGGDTYMVFQAAPPNAFQAAFGAIGTTVLASLR